MQSVFDALIRREQAEREQYVFAFAPESLRESGATKGMSGMPWATTSFLLLEHAVDVRQEGPASLGHHDHGRRIDRRRPEPPDWLKNQRELKTCLQGHSEPLFR